LDVSHDCRNVRLTHAERAITLLPREPMYLLLEPSGGIGLHSQHSLGKSHRRRNLEKKVDMVFHSANRVHKDFLVFADPRNIGPEALFHIARNRLAPLFCAENNVDYVLNVRVRQCVAPPALDILKHLFPGLTPWANFSTRLRRWKRCQGKLRLIAAAGGVIPRSLKRP
jgi:hypothetical protein